MTTDRLVVGIGNPDRGDDAAGILVARALQRTRATQVYDCATLLDVWEGESEVVVVDAMRSGKTPGTVVRFDATTSELRLKTVSSTHAFGLAETIELGRALGRLPSSLVVYCIEADGFDHGDSLTAPVMDAISEVVTVLDAEDE